MRARGEKTAWNIVDIQYTSRPLINSKHVRGLQSVNPADIAFGNQMRYCPPIGLANFKAFRLKLAGSQFVTHPIGDAPPGSRSQLGDKLNFEFESLDFCIQFALIIVCDHK